MSRKRSNTASSLPIPAPENIANREYYRASETNDAHPLGHDDIEYPPPDSSASPQQPNADTADASVSGDLVAEYVTVTPPSPSPSDIVAGCDLEDVKDMVDLEKRTRHLERRERKIMLFTLQEKLRVDRRRWAEEGKEERREELGREFEETERKGMEEKKKQEKQ
jgi:hypothetical protein